jgi:hypothetical protein
MQVWLVMVYGQSFERGARANLGGISGFDYDTL